jgi:hypothetical protein
MGRSVEGCLLAGKHQVSYGSLGDADTVVVDDCPEPRISWRLANHSRSTVELQRDFGDFDRKIDCDTDRSLMA